jgi:cysteinyl-tRNA synthetase
VPELLKRHRYDDVRWFWSMTHYRSKLAFSDELIDSAAEGFSKIRKLVRVLADKLSAVEGELQVPVHGHYASLRQGDAAVPRLRERFLYGEYGAITEKMMGKFIAAMDDDMNAPLATAALFDYVNELYAAGIEQGTDTQSVLAAYQALTRHLYVLGIEYPSERLFPELAAESFPAAGGGEEALAPYKQFIDRLLELRLTARKAKDFQKADLIRDLLADAGLSVEDTAQGPRWELA